METSCATKVIGSWHETQLGVSSSCSQSASPPSLLRNPMLSGNSGGMAVSPGITLSNRMRYSRSFCGMELLHLYCDDLLFGRNSELRVFPVGNSDYESAGRFCLREQQ